MFKILIQNKNFRYLWLSQFVSGLGDRLTQMGILTYVLIMAKDKGDKMALITFFSLMPFSLFGPLFGAIADKISRKKLMIFVDSLRAIFVAFIPFVWLTTNSVPFMLFWFFVLGSLGALFLPAKLSFIGNIAEKNDLVGANSIISTTALLTTLVGTLIAGFLIKIMGVRYVFYLNAIGYILSSLFVLRISYEKEVQRSIETANPYILLAKDVKSGLSYILKHSILLNLLVLSSVFAILSSLSYIFILNYSANVLKENSFGVGLILSSAGLGMVFGGLVLMQQKYKINYNFALYLAYLLIGLSLLGFVFKPSTILTLLFLFCAGFGCALFNITIDTIFQRLTPDELKSKIFSTKILLTNSIFLISLILAGLLVRTFLVTKLFGLLGILSLFIFLRIFLYGKLWGYQILRLFLLLLMRIIFNFKVSGRENLPKRQKIIFAGNHTSVIDGVTLMCAYPKRLYFLAAESLFRAGFWGFCARRLGYIPVKRSLLNKEAIKKAVEILRSGYSIGIFPEGRITEDGRLVSGKEGVAVIAKLSGACIVPFAIEGAYEAWPLPKKYPRRFPIELRFGRPIDAKDYPTQKELTEDVMKEIAKIKLSLEREGYLRIDPNEIVKHLIGV